ncbi:MAG: TonB-dependent receptor [Stagnimonas sp.]|nr:TonB-dependent receptor [Stagnimonas sp.]
MKLKTFPPPKPLRSLLLAAALLFALPAGAQDGSSGQVDTLPVQSLSSVSETPTAERDASAVQLDTVVVQGEKLGRKLSETSTSVSVFSGKNIEDQGDASLGDLLRRAANTSANEEGNLSIRSISQAGAGGGTGAPLISVQVDGVTLDRTSQQGALDGLFDVEQVEILRGAQSTSQGRNALAGAVVINTREPTRDWELRTRLGLAQRDGREFAAAGGGPISDTLAFRLLGSFENDDGFITHRPDGNQDFARMQKSLARAKLAWTPAANFDSLLTVGADRASGQPDYNIEPGEAGSDAAEARASTVNAPSYDLTRSGLASWRNRWRFAEGWTLTALSAYMRTQQDYIRDFDGLAEGDATNQVYNHGRNWSQELRLNLKEVGRFTGVVGVYGGRFADHNIYYSSDVFVTVPEATGVPLPVVGDLVGAELDFSSQADKDARNLAGFAEFDVKLPWQMTATLGLRYDRETLDTVSESRTSRADAIIATPDGLASLPLAGPLLEQLLALQPGIDLRPVLIQAPGVLPDSGGVQRGRTQYSALLPKLGLRWAFAPRWSTFTSYSEAYRAGGVDVDTETGESVPFDPEYTQNYEVGLRADYRVFDFATNVFYTDWRDQQVPVPRGRFFVTENASRSRLYGAEASFGWRPLPPLRLQLSLGTTNTKFIEYQTSNADHSGNRFIFAPRFTGSLGAVWRHQGVMAALNYSKRSHSYSTPENDPAERSEARELLDGRVGLEGARWRLYVYGRNLLSADFVTETYQFPDGYAGADTPRGYASYNAPRTFGVLMEFCL